ncbi:hypothetical protein [Sporolactobacillus sp. THM19-2]|uniref:hypothetical protein n=1 Tax=Sporolactobacillus sp. THM19-2 TaxID=2511171 RepID=UPI0010220F95|nr:hypothetical protein [Sporolactobacillus sp. THM19-2]RYL87270.1 hypothetical protein EWH91_13185 [Sporolactobacillus sp. THM19-2]
MHHLFCMIQNNRSRFVRLLLIMFGHVFRQIRTSIFSSERPKYQPAGPLSVTLSENIRDPAFRLHTGQTARLRKTSFLNALLPHCVMARGPDSKTGSVHGVIASLDSCDPLTIFGTGKAALRSMPLCPADGTLLQRVARRPVNGFTISEPFHYRCHAKIRHSLRQIKRLV